MFKKAEKKQLKLRLAISGPSGSGKTTSALLIAKGLGGKIAVVDTERGSASLYSNLVDFDVMELKTFAPEDFINAIHAAENEGYDVLILDSITHEWNGVGGILDIVNKKAKTMRGNSYTAWSEGTPRHQKFIDAILLSNLHVICTMRSKTAYVETENNGKRSYQKQGTEPQQRDGIEYEFTTVFDLTCQEHLASASKDRTTLFHDPFVITEDTGKMLKDWLNDGKSFEAQRQEEVQEIREAAREENDNPMSQNQRKMMFALVRQHTWGNDRDGVLKNISHIIGRQISTSNELTKDEIAHVIDVLSANE